MTSFLGLLAIAVLPAGLPIAFGRMVGRPRAGWALLGIMVILFAGGLVICDAAEQATPSRLADLGVAGGNMEGKEVRFGVGDSVLTAVVTSNGATGSNNSMNDSYQPLAVLVLLVNMLLGDVAFGGPGSGLTSMVMTALLAVFLGGLMVGRTPEYLGKTIGQGEAKWVALFALLTSLTVLPLTGLALATDEGRLRRWSGDQPPGRGSAPRGLTEVLFAYASCTANNGLSLAGLDANRLFYNLSTMLTMALGRFGLAGLALTLAGRVAAQGRKTATIGTLPCDTFTFGVLVLGTLLLVGALCFLPALALGPVAEYYKP